MRIAAGLFLFIVLVMPATAATDASNDVSPDTATAPPPIAAEPAVVDLLQSYNLFGTFALDCGRPAAPDNPRVSVSRESGGLVIETHDVGANYAANLYSVRSARRVADDRLEFKVVFVPGTRAEENQTLELMVGKGTRRTIFNRVDDGPVRVRRGVAVANGRKTPLLHKCP